MNTDDKSEHNLFQPLQRHKLRITWCSHTNSTSHITSDNITPQMKICKIIQEKISLNLQVFTLEGPS